MLIKPLIDGKTRGGKRILFDVERPHAFSPVSLSFLAGTTKWKYAGGWADNQNHRLNSITRHAMRYPTLRD
ncbi:hypothetical protein KCP71_01665 [Salmonella enterica subsp. enterica]|nr:hypothetical protein KCP71_01665 [Salmonella enterica subsp. enterica]